jgi:hypothetical protein
MSSFASALSAAPSVAAPAALDVIIVSKTGQRQQERTSKKGASVGAFNIFADEENTKGKSLAVHPSSESDTDSALAYRINKADFEAVTAERPVVPLV